MAGNITKCKGYKDFRGEAKILCKACDRYTSKEGSRQKWNDYTPFFNVNKCYYYYQRAGAMVPRVAHTHEIGGSNPPPATKEKF